MPLRERADIKLMFIQNISNATVGVSDIPPGRDLLADGESQQPWRLALGPYGCAIIELS